MTRSVEIPDAALEAADRAYAAAWRDRVPYPGSGMRAALVAARPYLMPQVDRQTLALLLANTVQTLDEDEEWYIADRVLALLNGGES